MQGVARTGPTRSADQDLRALACCRRERQLHPPDPDRLHPPDPDRSRWQPTPAAAAAAITYAADLFAGPSNSADEVRHEFLESVTFIDSGANTSIARCPAWARELDLAWVYDVIGERHPDLTDLDVKVPCCGSGQSPNELGYDWPSALLGSRSRSSTGPATATSWTSGN